MSDGVTQTNEMQTGEIVCITREDQLHTKFPCCTYVKVGTA